MRSSLAWPTIFLIWLLAAAPTVSLAQDSGAQTFSQEQLDQMLAPIALYPDSLLSQVLMASTYPVDVAEAVKWSKANPDQKGDAAVKAVRDKNWNPSVQSLTAFPQVLAMMGDKPDWVQTLGDAFLAQPDAVMDRVQFLRKKADAAGTLKSNEQQKVVTEQVQGWRFDMAAGADEIRTRRIGRNELNAMQVMLAYYDAQKEYAEQDRNADGIPEYARKLVSSPGQHDGLYWPADGAQESPLGPLFGGDRPGKTYHGYHFRILTRQGPAAPNGAYDYVIGGRMKDGFALVAWPAKYGDTGIMTFLVSHVGVVYQRDLGPGTDGLARRMTQFNPDAGWAKVDVPAHSIDTAQASGGQH